MHQTQPSSTRSATRTHSWYACNRIITKWEIRKCVVHFNQINLPSISMRLNRKTKKNQRQSSSSSSSTWYSIQNEAEALAATCSCIKMVYGVPNAAVSSLHSFHIFEVERRLNILNWQHNWLLGFPFEEQFNTAIVQYNLRAILPPRQIRNTYLWPEKNTGLERREEKKKKTFSKTVY